MVLFLCLIAGLGLWGIRYAGRNQFHQDYLDKESTLAIKGVFLLLVFASHFTQYVEYKTALSLPYMLFRELTGQLIVVPFLFYSGYGVCCSLKIKGYSYLKTMPLKRIARVLIQFDIAVLLFFLSALLMGNHITVKRLLLSLVGWDSVGNSNWYVFAILNLYFISYLSCMGLSEKGQFSGEKEAGWIMVVLTLCLVWILSRYKPGYFYNTLLAYPSGFLFCVYQEKIEKHVFRSDRMYLLVLTMLLMLLLIFRVEWKQHLSAYLAATVVFSGIVLLLTAKFQIHNRFLCYCGKHLFSLFILQRLPMMILAKTPLVDIIPVFFLCSLVITFLLSWLFDRIVPHIWSCLDKMAGTGERSALRPK